jgi:hypothetical protein
MLELKNSNIMPIIVIFFRIKHCYYGLDSQLLVSFHWLHKNQ